VHNLQVAETMICFLIFVVVFVGHVEKSGESILCIVDTEGPHNPWLIGTGEMLLQANPL
jgi:hypothetical protein